MKILVLEPYYGGSHKQFLDNLQHVVNAEYTFLTLPARKWKMRMQLSAPWFIQCLEEMQLHEREFDTVLCSTFIDVSVFRALTQTLHGWNAETRYCTYFHENQFAYPNQRNAPSSRQYAAINFSTALASDSLAFNSQYNKNSFLDNCRKYLSYASDMKLSSLVQKLGEKSSVIYPGIDFSEIDGQREENSHTTRGNGPPVIVWNHRWEHDKNPDEFFAGLYHLKEKNIAFKLIVLGQSFISQPDSFTKAKDDFSEELLHFGYAENYKEYISMLLKGDIVVSTAMHEFYGISVIEAVRAGCCPLLPNRLSYPELFDSSYLYKDGGFKKALVEAVNTRRTLTKEQSRQMTEKFNWLSLTEEYHRWLRGR